VNLIHALAAGALVAVVITLTTFAVVGLVNATTDLADRLQLAGILDPQRGGEAVAPAHSHDGTIRSTMKRT
jgi:hypothetical protein